MKNYRTKISLNSEDHENDELWAISYGDMITLLLSFFVIFFSTDFKKDKVNNINLNFVKNLKNNDKNDLNELKNKDLKLNIKNAKINIIEGNIYLSFDKQMFFKKGEIDHVKNIEPILDDFYIKYLPYISFYKLEIKAFTDTQRVKRKKGRRFDDNLELSTLRALNIIKYFQKKGIPLNKMELAGYGEYDKLNKIFNQNEFKKLTKEQKEDMSRTIVLIIKPNENNL